MIERNPGLDTSRGIAMLLVVIGHNPILADMSPTLINFIFLFHVAAFFFISGFLIKPDGVDFNKLFFRIIAPFLLFGAALSLVKALVRKEDALLAFIGVLWGTGATSSSSQLWFLPALFLTLLSAQWIVGRWQRNLGLMAKCIDLAIILLLAYGALQLPDPPVEMLRRPGVAGSLGWIWNIDLVPVALLFCLVGHLVASNRLLAHVPMWALLVISILATVSVFILGARTDLNMRVMSPYLLAMIGGVAGAIMVLMLGQLVASTEILASFLTRVGRHTMSILLFHILFQNAALNILGRLAPHPSSSVALTGATVGVAAGLLCPMVGAMILDHYMPILRRILQQKG
ncbi:acyltransferase family protein [Zavarzinia compransoris]|uniref:Acyltransferase 3 domain-containing protein n=1 Tax=Zavarzinia compransoris TaxID=1264899 RepID=A0A317E8U3_9PROT|nr:acyltransferase family protein [Zavarzinia compransoris]PWR21545.1 hypothetical protein DKG75_05930 [Zavarzinia compransoris]TDP45688.1 fucose 4-O-acetylase-like acetyltransferase [Zavarzinia compransoris]